jgi:NTE family protein
LLEGILGARDGAIPGIEANLQRGELKAAAITTSSYTTGQSITWVQGCGIPQWERAHRKSVNVALGVRHVMASAALPIFFPAIEIDGQWCGDGGIRLTAPLSPAVHLGAGRILAISTRYQRTRAEADLPSVSGYPPPAQIVGTLFNAVFLDLFDADALTMERVNNAMEMLPLEKRQDYRTIRLIVLRPSRDLGKLANEYEARLPGAFRFLTRGLGTRETRSNDLLSLLMFQPDYLSRLIELGEADAEARREEIKDFLENTQPRLT